MALTKPFVIKAILEKLDSDLALAISAAENARDTATSKENIAENKYDTLGLEAAYLAHGQSNRAQRLAEERSAFAALSQESDSDTVVLGSLVSVNEPDDSTRWIFVGPGAAGLTLSVENHEFVVVTRESPLGASLWGLSVDEIAKVNGVDLEVCEIL
jgi:transcription elongation GreA/GreB family factor